MTAPVTLRLIGENGQLVGVLRTSAEETEKFKKKVKETDDVLGKFHTKGKRGLEEMGGAFSKTNASALELARTLAAGLGFAGFVASIVSAINQAREFNKSIAQVSTALADTSNLDNYAKKTREFALQYGQAASKQAASLYEIISAGQSAEQAIETLDSANKLAIGGFTQVEVAADGLTSIMNAYAASAITAADASDILFVGAAAGKTNIEQLSSTLGTVAPIAATVGVEFDELVASIAALTLAGVSTNVAVTQVRAALAQVIKPSGEAAELAAKLGLQFNVAAVQAKGLSGFLEDVRDKTGGSTEAIATLFGSVEATAAVLALTGTQAEQFAGVLEQMEERAGKTDIAVAKMANTADAKFNRAIAAANELLIRFGTVVLEVIAPAAEAFANNVNDIAAAIELAATITAGYVAIFVVLPGLYGLATAAATRFTAAIIAQNLAMGMGITATKGMGAALLANIQTIGLLKVAAGTLFAAFAGWQIGTYLYDQFSVVRQAGIYMIDSLMKGWEQMKAAGKLAWEGIKLIAIGSIDLILENFANMLRVIASMSDFEIMGERLFGGSVDKANELADAMSNLLTPMDNYTTAAAEIIKQRDDEIAKINETTQSSLAWELVQRKAVESQKKAATSVKATTVAIAAQGVATGNSKEELKKFAAEADRAWKSLEAHLQMIDDYQEARRDLEQGYENEIELLGRTNEERRVGDVLMRYMQDNYEYLIGLSDEAAKSELERADATIRAGEATIRAQMKVNDLVSEFGRLDDMGFVGLIGGLANVRKELERVSDASSEAYDPERAAELRETLVGMNFAIAKGTVGSLQDATDAMSTLFEEGSKGQKKMQQASAILTVVQAALASVEGVRAILKQGSEGDVYSAFARMAAMAGAVAPLIAAIGGAIPAFGGGGGGGSSGAEARQATQGRGTVLGEADAQSESMRNAMEITAEATSELVGISRAQLVALQGMLRGISGAAGSLARGGFADLSLAEGAGMNSALNPFGVNTIGGRVVSSIFGGDQDLIDQGLIIGGGSFGNVSRNPNASSYQTIETDGGWFGSDDVDDELEGLSEQAITQIQLILQSIGDAVRAGAEALGLDMEEINRAIEAFRIEEIRISTMDLTGEEAQAELEAAFSAIFDNLAGSVVPFIDQFQRVGEGLGETLVRVATSVQVVQEGIAQLGWASEQMDPEQMAQMSVALIEASGGIAEFIKGMQSFVSAFAPESHRFAIAQDELTRGLEQVGLTLPTTRDGMWELMQSLDRTTESGQAQIAALLRLSGTADAYYDFLEQRADDALAAAEAAAQAERDRLDLISQARQINNGAIEAFRPRGNDREEAINNVNRQIADFRAQLIAIGDPLNQSAGLEAIRTQAIIDANAAIDEQINKTLDDLAFDLNIDGLDEVAYAQANVNRQYDQYYANLVQQGATTEQLTRLEELRTEALEQATEAAEENTRATEHLTISLGDLFNQLGQYLADLRKQFEHLMNPGFRNWIEEMTGFEPNTPETIVTRAGTVSAIGSEYGAAISSINSQIVNAQAELASLGSINAGPQRAIIQQRIRQLQQLLGEVTGTMADALEYANDLFDQQIGGLLESLRSEFGANDPIAQINDRFDTLIAQATAWGASMSQLAEIEAFRIIALERAEEEAFQQQMEWFRQLRGFRDDLLLDENLSTLTPLERMEEARRQYEIAQAAAAGGDPNAQNTFQEAARAYLEQLRAAYGSSDVYEQGFNQVLDDINEMLANSPLGSSEALLDAVGGDGESESRMEVNVDNVESAIVEMHEDMNEGFTLVVGALMEVRTEVAAVKVAADGTRVAVDRLAESGFGRTTG